MRTDLVWVRVRSGTLSRFEIPAKMFSARDIAAREILCCSGDFSVCMRQNLGLATPHQNPANWSFYLNLKLLQIV